MCQTPPRVVTHQIWVLNPNRRTSQTRSASERTPSRAAIHQHRPRSIAARPALTIGCQMSLWVDPKIATIGISRIAGNGPNGT